MQVALQNLVNRITVDEEFLEKYPENKEMLERKIMETKKLIIHCVLQNDGNSLLERIALK